MAANDAAAESADAVRAEWVARLDRLVADVRAWAEAAGWVTRVRRVTKRDARLGEYVAPALLLQHGENVQVKALLEPVARFAAASEGTADLYQMPAYDDVARLYYADGVWRILDTAADDNGHPADVVVDRASIQDTLAAMRPDVE